MTRRLRLYAALLFSSLLLTACDFDVYSLPLPGGADTGEDPIELQVEFADVLDLVPQSAVKFNEVNVGKVTDIELGGEADRTAIVTLEVRNDTGLPANAHAAIRQTSLLGEKFVSLTGPPSGEPQGELGTGDVIPLARTGRNPEVEEVLGALSLVLNGGGIAQLKTIATELNLALEGREENVKSALRQIDDFVGQLDSRKGDIVNALEALNRLSEQVRTQQGSIDRALDELPTALLSLDSQREDLVSMLESLNELSEVGVRVIDQTKDITIESLEQLFPVLDKLADSGEHLVESLQVVTFPIGDGLVGKDPQVARNLHMGDYVNLSVELQLDLADPNLPTICIEDIDAELPCSEVIGPILDCLTEQDLDTCSTVPTDILEGLSEQESPLTEVLGQLGLSRPGTTLGAPRSAPADGPLAGLGEEHDADLVDVLGAPLTLGGAR